MQARELIIAPPPTPNGDLHVGHMSGPYLAADVYKRHAAQYGVRAYYAVSTDDSQSYVDTTAARLQMRREDLVERSRNEIRETLSRYAIDVDHFGQQDDAYRASITAFFSRLHRAKLFDMREVDVLYDDETGEYPIDAHVKGKCPSCLADSCGGICEACGKPNGGFDLLRLKRKLSVRREQRLVLDLERYRSAIEPRLTRMGPFRPALTGLLEDLLAKPLKPFVLSHKTPRGISTAFAGLPGQTLDVWAEMYAGHLTFLSRAAGELSSADRYLQFLGFDNSYFYAILHTCLEALAAKAEIICPESAALVTNQFYLLEDAKFSTSLGHLIWARDLSAQYHADAARFYLAMRGPEYQEISFSPSTFDKSMARTSALIDQVVDSFNKASSSSSLRSSAAAPPNEVSGIQRKLPAKAFSMGTLARRTANAIELLAHDAEQMPASLAYVPNALALCLAPFCPRYAAEIHQRFRGLSESWERPLVPCAQGTLPRFPVRTSE